MRAKQIILASVLGGTGLILLCLVAVALLHFIPRRRRQRQEARQLEANRQQAAGADRVSSTWKASGDVPRTSETRTIRPVTPSPSRLPSPPSPSTTQLVITRTPPPVLTAAAGATRWDLEKANAATTPPGHPAMAATATVPSSRRRRSVETFLPAVSRVAAGYANCEYSRQPGSNINNNTANTNIRVTDTQNNNDIERQQSRYLPTHIPLHLLPHPYPHPCHHYYHPPQQQHPNPPPPPPLAPQDQSESISSTFAAEMSSLLDSISFKSSYSSLRSGDGGSSTSSGHGPTGLTAPPPILTPPPPPSSADLARRERSPS